MSKSSDTENLPVAADSNLEGGGPKVSPDFSGVIEGLDFDDYLAADAVSKSSLWTLQTKSPAHARVQHEPSNAMQLGTAIHCAVLEPDELEERFICGPDDRRGNRWKEAVCIAEDAGKTCLTSGDYITALAAREKLQQSKLIQRLTGAGTVREVSAFWTDELTGLRCRARPDAFVPALNMMVDLKTTTDARADKWVRNAVHPFGYHAQEAFYTDGWRAVGHEVDAFVFIVLETNPPCEFQIYELLPDAVEEGRAMMRAALERWKACVEADEWPGYSRDIQPLDIPPWAYTLTKEKADD